MSQKLYSATKIIPAWRRNGVGAEGVGRRARARRRARGRAASRRARRARGGGGAGRRRCGEARWRAAVGERTERAWRERMRRKNERAVYFLSLPRARDLALGKDFLKILKYSLPSARSLALGKVSFAECLQAGTRQSMLCRVSFVDTWQITFLFFYFPNQNFCVVFLHYIDRHVPFWDNYKSVFYS
jgi:hypothetical protein